MVPPNAILQLLPKYGQSALLFTYSQFYPKEVFLIVPLKLVLQVLKVEIPHFAFGKLEIFKECNLHEQPRQYNIFALGINECQALFYYVQDFPIEL